MIAYDLDNKQITVYEADKYIKASDSKYDYYREIDDGIVAYFLTDKKEEKINYWENYIFAKINGELYQCVFIGRMEDTVSVVKGKEKITMGIKSFYEYKKQFAPVEKPKPIVLEQLQLF